ncbi:hypothetical protein VNO80_07385 [Phaseolus coccineus]|uniref:TIR domain-containing protein n=1 Tax=Phaseolus coccineus TaxID=3886 RepID=A0AAN9NNL7_PHACN
MERMDNMMYDINHPRVTKMHQRRYETNKVQIWRDSLKKSTEISGIASSKYPVHAELVKEIVKVVLEKLARPSVTLKRLVGIDEKIAMLNH